MENEQKHFEDERRFYERERRLKKIITALTAGMLVFAVIAGMALSRTLVLEKEHTENSRMSQLRDYVGEYFYRDYDTEQADDYALKGYIAGLDDPYSVFLTKDEYSGWQQKESGVTVGIGVTVSMTEEGLYVTEVNEGGPADVSGIKTGDVITHVDGVEYDPEKYEEFVGMVRGEEGTEVCITAVRDGKSFEKKITRSSIELLTSHGMMLSDNIAYIRVSAFRYNTDEQFLAALDDVLEKGAEGIIFDMRGNGGGMLSSLENMINPILPEGEIAIANYGDGTVTTIVTAEKGELDIPMAVLVNGGTASAAELFAASLRDFGKAFLVGETTFGKGVMQETREVAGGAVTLTTATYQTVRGECYQGTGLEPDIKAELPEGFIPDFDSPDTENDTQLAKALEEIKKQK